MEIKKKTATAGNGKVIACWWKRAGGRGRIYTIEGETHMKGDY